MATTVSLPGRSPWVGIDPQVDPVRWARLLRRAHELALSKGTPPSILRDLVARSWRRAASAGVDPDGPAPKMLDAARDGEGARRAPRLAPAAADREHARRGDRGRPLLRRAQRRGGRAAVGGRASARRSDRGRPGLSARAPVQRARGRDQRRRHGPGARSPGADLLGRALQPPPARLDLLGGADPRPREPRDPRRARPVRRASAPVTRTACRWSPPSRAWSRTSWPRSRRAETSASRRSISSGSRPAPASEARW